MLHRARLTILLACLLGATTSAAPAADTLSGFRKSPHFGESIREIQTHEGIRAIINLHENFHPDRPTLIVFYATPNGNTIQQTLGSGMAPAMDWHFDIQHIAAQTRMLRTLDRSRNIALVCAEAEGLSWPAWRSRNPDNARLIRQFIEETTHSLPGTTKQVALAAHSGGGSFIFGFINAFEQLPEYLERIVFLDANYGYSDDDRHGDRLLDWLSGDTRRRLVVIAYDDRDITLNGRKVVTTGGTFRATHRILGFFEEHGPVLRRDQWPLRHYVTVREQAHLYIHSNPRNRILHTVMVGEMNGFLHGMTLGTDSEDSWGSFSEGRAYKEFIQSPPSPPATSIPPRPADSRSGHAVMESAAGLSRQDREQALLQELLEGNIPQFLRQFQPVTVQAVLSDGQQHTIEFEVMPDYLAIGSDSDFVRVCINPYTAQATADAFGCSLLTAQLSDAIHNSADLKLEPHPLTEEREAVRTFVQHSNIINSQFHDHPFGTFVSGIKKDVVITPRLQERPNRVAIYGWHRLNGEPIQPLTTVHVDWYVDYSHGIRLVKREVKIDGQSADLWDVLAHPILSGLLSNEGPLKMPHY